MGGVFFVCFALSGTNKTRLKTENFFIIMLIVQFCI